MTHDSDVQRAVLPRLFSRDFRLARLRRIVVKCFLVVPVAVLALGAFCACLHRSRLKYWRELGIREAESGDPVIALENLKKYLSSRPDDADALLVYAMTRQNIIAPKKLHLLDSIEYLERCSELTPQNFSVWIELAKLQNALGRNGAALLSAQRAYRLAPSNGTAIGLLVNAMLDVGSYAEVRDLLEILQRSRLMDWRIGLARLRFVLATQGTSEHLVTIAEEHLTHSPRDPRMLLVKASANWLLGGRVIAHTALKEAIQKAPVEDIAYLRALVRLASDMRAEEHGIELLSRMPNLDDPFLTLWFARNCWELGRPREIVRVLTRREIPLVTEPESNMLLAISLVATGQFSKLQELLRSIEEQQTTEASRRWGQFIVVACSSGDIDERAVINASKRVLAVCPASPIVRYMQALAYYESGEFRIAAKLAKQASRLAPNWVVLRHLEVTATLIVGEVESALAESRRTYEEFPNDFNAALSLASVAAVALPAKEEEYANRILEWTRQVDLPSTDPRLQDVALIRFLAFTRLGCHAQAGAIADEMDIDPDIGNYGDLIRLSAQRRFFSMGQVGEANVQDGGMKEEVSHALSTYQEVGQEFSKGATASSAELKRMIAQENGVEVGGELIDLLESTSPAGAISWRLLKARWLLQDAKSERNAAAAALLLRPVLLSLPESADTHLLMGAAMFRLHDHGTGVEHFLSAAEYAPRSAATTLRLSLNCRRNQEWPDARSLVDFWTELTRVEMNRQSKFDAPNAEPNIAADNRLRQLIDRLLVLAEYAEQTKDSELAIEAYRQILILDPKSHLACNNLAFLIYQLPTQWTEARTLAWRATAAVPTSREYRSTLESILEFKNDENVESQSIAADAAH